MTKLRRIYVQEWADLQQADDPSDAELKRVASVFSRKSWDFVIWVPSWVLDDEDKEIETVASSDHLVGADGVEDYSEKAWQIYQRSCPWGEYLPKSAVWVFERAEGIESIDTPQADLTAFGGEADA